MIASIVAGSIQAKDEIAITVSFEKHEIEVPVRSGITLGALIRIADPKFEWHEVIENYTDAEWNASSVLVRGDRISMKRRGAELIKTDEGTNQRRILTAARLSIEIKDGDKLRSSPLSTL